MSTTKRLISDISNKFSSSEKKKASDSDISMAATRRAEREARRTEEDQKYNGMKPVQAMFSKSIAARSKDEAKNQAPVLSSVSVSELKDKVSRRKSLISGSSSRNSVDLDFIPDLPVASALDVYTKGNCRTLTDKFETDIQIKKSSLGSPVDVVPKTTRRNGGVLPDMFEQQKKRDENISFAKTKGTGIINKESINGFLNKFEDSDSPREANERMIELTKKQKTISTPKWNERSKAQSTSIYTNENNSNDISIAIKPECDELQDSKKKSKNLSDAKDVSPTNKVSNKLDKPLDQCLPSIKTSTLSDMKQKLQNKKAEDSYKTYKPIRKLSLNQFEEYSKRNQTYFGSPSIISNAPKLSDIKKRLVVDESDVPTSFVAFKSKKAKVEEDKSKETLSESHNAMEATDPSDIKVEAPSTHDSSDKRSSKSQMQNYLLSKVLFEDNTNNQSQEVKKEDPMEIDFIDETPVDIMNDPYFQEIEKYLSLIGETEKKTSKSKKSTKPKKKNLKLKVVELDKIKNKFESKKESEPSSATSPAVISNLLLDKKVNKYKEKFESERGPVKAAPANNVRRRSGVISSDLLCKFDSPEELERLKKQREEEREARRKSRLQKLEEEQRRLEEEAHLERESLEAERLENERRMEEERARLAEEARIAAACEEMMRKEKEKAEARREREEEAKSLREKNEPALKKKKVLGRIQHIFEKDKKSNTHSGPSAALKAIGSIKDKAEGLFQNKSEGSKEGKTPFQDSSLTGMSVNRFKDKFELSKQEEPLHLFSKSEKKKRVPLKTAIDFDSLNQDKQVTERRGSNTESEWAWKKKDQGQLAVETTMAIIKTSPNNGEKKTKASSSSEASQRRKNSTDELLKELHSASERLSKKDAIQEHELKMKEYEEFIDEIQSFLNEPIQDISDCLDEVRKEKKKAKKKSSTKSISSKESNKLSEVIGFIKRNDKFIPPHIRHKIKYKMDYKEFLRVIDAYLRAPDGSVEEIEFKDKLETILDTLEADQENGPDITRSCKANQGSGLLPDVVEGGLRSRRRSLGGEGLPVNKSSSMTDFQNELSKYRSLLDSNAAAADSKWKIGKVDTSFLQESEKDEYGQLDGKRVGPPSAMAKEIQSKLVASFKGDESPRTRVDKKKKVLVDTFVPKEDEPRRGLKDLKQFIYKHRSELPDDIVDFDCTEKELMSRIKTFAFSEEEKPLKEEIKIYLELAGSSNASLPSDSIRTDHVSDMRKKILESSDPKVETNELFSAPRRKVKQLETSYSAKDLHLPIEIRTPIKPTLSTKVCPPSPPPVAMRPLSKSASDATVFRQTYNHQTSTILDPKEREAAILAKYGVKPRPPARDSSSESDYESSEEEEEEDIKKLISQDPRLQSIYGDRLLSSKEVPRASKRGDDSLNSLRNILGAMRQPTSLSKSNSSQSMKKAVFEKTEKNEEVLRKNSVQKSTSFANIKNLTAQAEEESRPSWQCSPSGGLARSSSFHKFKSAIENGEEESVQQSSGNNQVQAELDAIRSCSRLQRLFAINKPSPSAVSRSNPALEEGSPDISQARESIRSAFESTHAKMSYGVKLHSEKKPIKAAPQRPKQAGNNWIYDTINKYFDVIVEDDESEESESCSSEEESSDLEIEDFETIISSRNNYALQKTKSSAKLRSMVSSLMVEKSISVDSMGTFKNNLNSYLQKSKSVVS